MADLSQILPPKNHNNPPSELEILQENMTLRYVHLMRDAEEKAKLAEKIPAVFTAQNEADFISDYIKQIADLQKSLESARKEEKEPFLRQGQIIDGFFKGYDASLSASADKAKAPLGKWLAKCAAEEQARREQEAVKLRAEAAIITAQAVIAPSTENLEVAVEAQHASDLAQKVAAVPVQTMATATGKYSKAGLKKEWVGVILNPAEVELEKLRAYIKPEALQVALNAYVKMGGRECKGCLIEEQTKVGVR